MNEFPRKFKEHSHQHYATGICHGIGLDKDNRPVAILEYENGHVRVRRLDEHYSIELGPSQAG